MYTPRKTPSFVISKTRIIPENPVFVTGTKSKKKKEKKGL